MRCVLALAVAGLLLQPGCLFRKNKAPSAPTIPAPVRIVLLPMNVPPDKEDLRWLSFATEVRMMEAATAVPDLELVPLWESLPASLQTLGVSRTTTEEVSNFIAARLSARWATDGRIIPAKEEYTFRIDFVPARPSQVPFRFEKISSIESMDSQFREAFEQLARYLNVRPPEEAKAPLLDLKKLREIAQAIDVEYGWFSEAKPGSAGALVGELAARNRNLARLLFSPTLYPVLEKQQ
jgi:hypothetical protein